MVRAPDNDSNFLERRASPEASRTAWLAESVACLARNMTEVFRISLVACKVEMAINAELNDYTVITDADPVFIVAEIIFCIFFTTELVISRLATFADLNRPIST